jgi:hypothetical protein
MAEKVKLSKDGSSIDFVASDSLPTSIKKFRQSPEIEGFYRFIFENDLQKEAYEILNRIIEGRKAKKAQDKKAAKDAARLEKQMAAEAAKKTKTSQKVVAPKAVTKSAKPSVARPIAAPKVVAKTVVKPAAKAAAKPAPKIAVHVKAKKPAPAPKGKAVPAKKAKKK